MMSLGEAAVAIGASPRGADVRFDSVSSDSRTLAPGALFVALRGERYDGHDFIEAARARGAAAAMVEQSSGWARSDLLPLLVVADTRAGLARLAAHWRRRFSIPLIAVCGSNGKTTVKEMIAAILRAEHGAERALATEGNLNNTIGLPLTLLRLRDRHRAAVVEFGINHPGETETLAAIAAPTVALVNNAQREHQEFLKSVDAVAKEHAAVFAALPADGVAVVNADDPCAPLWRTAALDRRRVEFGLQRPAQVGARYRPCDFGSEVALRTPAGEVRIALHAFGRHNVMNALAAAAAALAAGASLEAVAAGLAAFRPLKGRLLRRTTPAGASVIDDSYNANPDSVRAAIDVLAAAPGRRLLVLGDMGEVGEQGPAFHEEVARYARARGIEALFTVGALGRRAAEAFGAAGQHFEAIEDLIAAVRAELAPGATVLVKGSRFMRMERVVEALCGIAGEAAGGAH